MKILKNSSSIVLFIAVFSTSVLLNCSKEKNPISSQSQSGFGIYFLQNSDLKYHDVVNVSINSIKISNTPVATEKHIEYYKIFRHSKSPALAHAIKFKKDMKKDFGDTNRPFLIIAHSERIYLGKYWANFMNTFPPDIFIYPHTSSEFHIMSRENGVEKINDKRIINSLKKSGIEIVYKDIGNN